MKKKLFSFFVLKLQVLGKRRKFREPKHNVLVRRMIQKYMYNLKSFELNPWKVAAKGLLVVVSTFFLSSSSHAYPIFAQQNYENPREANGRIVCANCHLAQKPVEIEVPQAVLPDTVFEAVVKIPYDKQIKQVLANGKKGDLNVGAVLILPAGFE